MPPPTFKAEVAGIGEDVWSGNALLFGTREAAEAYIYDLAGRWFGFDLGRVVTADTPKRQPVDLNDPTIVYNARRP